MRVVTRPVSAPYRVTATVVALLGLSAAAPFLYRTGPVGYAALLVPLGLLLALAWLIRLGQWMLAAGAPPWPARLTLHLAQSPQAQQRGRAVRVADAVGRTSDFDATPAGYAVWAVLQRGSAPLLNQRVVWERWLRELTGEQRVLVRRRAGVAVLDVEGRGRIWPSSFTLRRRPWGVALTPLGGTSAGNDLSWWRLLTVVVLVVALLAGPAVGRGDHLDAVWAAVYVVVLAFGVGQWFGVMPPGRQSGQKSAGSARIPGPRAEPAKPHRGGRFTGTSKTRKR
ncbi:hypothetical protein GCM10009662_25280 [Catellatospora coxensis]|uniref:Uncharacterized protein n=1 Tax=Catellatospora coxensis TaxID=310354 RepID=A0A8J3P7R5_9ACTN|nr:hypothetical protein Cco03nite_34540 [Catellatospora coxensis]